MGYEFEAQRILSRFAAEWTDNGDELTPIAWPNTPFDPPQSGAWVRITIQPSTSRVASIAGPYTRFRHDGDVVVEIFAPHGDGTETALMLADRAAAIFRGFEHHNLTFFAPRMVHVGNRDGWYRVNVICPYQRDTAFAHQ